MSERVEFGIAYLLKKLQGARGRYEDVHNTPASEGQKGRPWALWPCTGDGFYPGTYNLHIILMLRPARHHATFTLRFESESCERFVLTDR